MRCCSAWGMTLAPCVSRQLSSPTTGSSVERFSAACVAAGEPQAPACGGGIWQVVEDKWLLDPTLDQANKKEWPRSMRVGPLAIRLPGEFWAEHGSILIK